ncbi:MAG: nucleotide sugar dehydrogenase, partial [Acidimicrobiia bacterium]
AEIVILAVGTPSDENGIDLTHLEQATRSVAEALAGRTDFPVVVVKSTVVPGTTSSRVAPILEEAGNLQIGVSVGLGVNPEFLTEGSAVHDFTVPDRIVIGADDERTAAVMGELYAAYGAPKIVCGTATAEMIKYASNTLLSTLISFSNEIALLSARIEGVDVADVMAGVHASRYLSVDGERAEIASFVFPGAGYGGSCLPKDTVALAAHGRANGVQMELLEQVEKINRNQPHELMRIVNAELGDLHGRTVGVLGLAFKPGTDDVRESPSFPVIELLLEAGAQVIAHDPIAIPNARRWLGERAGLVFEPELTRVVEECEALVLVTSWEDYRQLPELINARAEPPVLVDGRRYLPRSSVPRYAGVGL